MKALAGRRAAITGASRGLGLAIARAFVAEGASVLIGARGLDALEAAVAELGPLAAPGAKVLHQEMDCGDPVLARAFISRAAEDLGGLDILVNNAGVHGPIAALEYADWEQWVQAVKTNLLGPALLCREALSLLRDSGHGRIINLSGGGATAPMPNRSAYAASKAALVRLTETLALELEGSGVTVNAIAPGAMNTRLLDEVLEAGPKSAGAAYYAQAQKQKAEGGTPPETPAALCVALASDAGAGLSGRLISAVWDDWKDLGALAAKVRGTDIYTLRRIVPADRAKGPA